MSRLPLADAVKCVDEVTGPEAVLLRIAILLEAAARTPDEHDRHEWCQRCLDFAVESPGSESRILQQLVSQWVDAVESSTLPVSQRPHQPQISESDLPELRKVLRYIGHIQPDLAFQIVTHANAAGDETLTRQLLDTVALRRPHLALRLMAETPTPETEQARFRRLMPLAIAVIQRSPDTDPIPPTITEEIRSTCNAVFRHVRQQGPRGELGIATLSVLFLAWNHVEPDAARFAIDWLQEQPQSRSEHAEWTQQWRAEFESARDGLALAALARRTHANAKVEIQFRAALQAISRLVQLKASPPVFDPSMPMYQVRLADVCRPVVVMDPDLCEQFLSHASALDKSADQQLSRDLVNERLAAALAVRDSARALATAASIQQPELRAQAYLAIATAHADRLQTTESRP